MSLTKEDLKSIEKITERTATRVAEKIVVKHVEELAIITAKGFQAVQDQINKIQETLNEHTKILDEHTKTLDEHTKMLDEHTERFNEVDRRFDNLQRWQNAQQGMLDSHDRRIDILENKGQLSFASA